MQSLQGRVALITGVSRRNGIGYGIAKRLASMGADLFLHSFQPYDKEMPAVGELCDLEILVDELRSFGTAVDHLEADFLEPESPGRVMNTAAEKLGHIDIVVLNHTRDTLAEFQDLTAEEIDKHLSVNVRAALLLIQAYSKQHDGRAGGRIILLTSGQDLGPMPHLAYVACKGALHQLTASLSDIFIDTGITVNTVNPGPTRTYQPPEAVEQEVLKRMPLERWGEPADAARLIGWLVSDDAMWVTGQVVNSEGGFRRG